MKNAPGIREGASFETLRGLTVTLGFLITREKLFSLQVYTILHWENADPVGDKDKNQHV